MCNNATVRWYSDIYTDGNGRISEWKTIGPDFFNLHGDPRWLPFLESIDPPEKINSNFRSWPN
jgi:hypothetical protein